MFASYSYCDISSVFFPVADTACFKLILVWTDDFWHVSLS